MRAARLREYGKPGDEPFEIVDVDEPTVSAPTDVVVEVAGAGFCQTDLKLVKDEGLPVELPLTLGHENAGTVRAVGENVTAVAPGDKVNCLPGKVCGKCQSCRRDESYVYCENLEIPGMHTDGGFAEAFTTSEQSVVRLESLDPVDIAPVADAGLSSYHPVKRATRELDPDSHILLIGIGGLGHLGLQAALLMTGAATIAADIRPTALDLAESCGADHVVNSRETDLAEEVDRITDGDGVDQVVDFVGTPATFNEAPDLLGTGGEYHLVGYTGTVEIPAVDMIASEISIRGSRGGRYSELVEIIDLFERGKLEIHTERYGLAEINDVAAALANGEIQGRAVIELQG